MRINMATTTRNCCSAQRSVWRSLAVLDNQRGVAGTGLQCKAAALRRSRRRQRTRGVARAEWSLEQQRWQQWQRQQQLAQQQHILTVQLAAMAELRSDNNTSNGVSWHFCGACMFVYVYVAYTYVSVDIFCRYCCCSCYYCSCCCCCCCCLLFLVWLVLRASSRPFARQLGTSGVREQGIEFLFLFLHFLFLYFFLYTRRFYSLVWISFAHLERFDANAWLASTLIRSLFSTSCRVTTTTFPHLRFQLPLIQLSVVHTHLSGVCCEEAGLRLLLTISGRARARMCLS